MYRNLTVGAVIPARDEQDNIGPVVEAILNLRTPQGHPVVDDVVVCDNGSTDETALQARKAGARVVVERRAGYGPACLAAIAALQDIDVVLFVDGDQSVDVGQSVDLLDAIAEGADLAVGSRTLGRSERGALSAPQRAGNFVASQMIRLLWGCPVTDLGPFRAIRSDALRRLDMRATAYGWTVEMQVKAIQSRMRLVETPVDTRRRRFGKSKVGGNIRGVMGASAGILSTIAWLWLCGIVPHLSGRIGRSERSAGE